MAKLLKQPTFILVVGLLALAAADPLLNLDGGEKSKGIFGFNQKHEEDEKGKLSVSFSHKKESSDSQGEASTGGDQSGCKCGDTQVKEFFDKFLLLFRAYGSKELAPEIRSIAVKIADFIMGYLAQEKPDEMGKFHNFLQSSVKVTGEAVSKTGRSKRNFGSFK